MSPSLSAKFLSGVIEGFYGQPWSHAERLELFAGMAAGGLNTYVYAPKDDLHHRALWRERYPDAAATALAELIDACRRKNLRFIYALGPGLDLRYADDAELDCLRGRCEQLLGLGCTDFALLFDDIPDRLTAADAARFGTFASAQSQVANALFRWCRDRAPHGRFLFCPTPYCGRMAGRGLGGADYLATLGRELAPEIDVFWTGPEIVSPTITVPHVREVRALLRRPPMIWDNLHANDYDGRRFFCGPYAGRAPELRAEVGGLLLNPNCEFPLNYVPLRTFAEFVLGTETWHARDAYLAALRAWLPAFATVGRPITLEELILLGDSYYLPHEDGPEADALLCGVTRLLDGHELPPADVTAFRLQATRLRDLCGRLAELRERPLFHALCRRIWELREELDLLLRYVDWTAVRPPPTAPCQSDFHLPGTYRGGLVARLQDLLVPQPDGTFLPSRRHPRPPGVKATS